MIGFIGTGAMGTEMVLRLLAAGHDVTVHNRTRGNARVVEDAGARWALLDDVASRCDVVLACLRDTDAVLAVHGELIAAARPGQVFVEHGTFDPAAAVRLAVAAEARGAAFLDIPVTGGPDGAREGRLTAMAGGAVDQIRPLLAAYCATVTRVGGPGAGARLKLVNQLLVGVHMAVAGEALALLGRLGVDLAAARPILTAGWANSTMLARDFTQVASGELAGTGVTIDGMVEVQSLVTGLLDGFDAPVFEAARQTFADAARAGLGSRDPAAFAVPVEREVRP